MKTHCCHPPLHSSRCVDCPFTVPQYSGERLITAAPVGTELAGGTFDPATQTNGSYYRCFPKRDNG